MNSIFKNLTNAMLFNAGSSLDCPRHCSTEVYIANLSDENLTITALLPDDAEQLRSLVFSIIDEYELAQNPTGTLRGADRERTLRPGEVAQLALKKGAGGKHISLFRVRKETQAGSCFLKYTVTIEGNASTGSIVPVGTQDLKGKLENVLPHLLYVW